MAYGNYFQNYQNPYYPYQQSAQAPQNTQNNAFNSGIPWVQGIAGAKSFMVMPGQSVLLMDSESNSFYIKSADASGMPLPLRIFDYNERKAEETAPEEKSRYVTREEVKKMISELVEGEK